VDHYRYIPGRLNMSDEPNDRSS